jgi:hypothetical protein
VAAEAAPGASRRVAIRKALGERVEVITPDHASAQFDWCAGLIKGNEMDV